jgi:predicted unusual protein kinase regulating ubiquinone biosynthesis (AarF/ABC1/UbiB family)
MTRSIDDGSIAGRWARQGRISLLLGRMAARLAQERYLGGEESRQAFARELREALGGLRGAPAKLAQFVATVPGLLPPEYMAELAHLQAGAPPMGWPMVQRRMNAELGRNWQHHFARFDHQSSAAASLGQVHKARAHDGRELACKLQYPGIESAVDADMRQLRVLLGLFAQYDKAISTENVYDELKARMAEELDYRLEARRIHLFGELLADHAGAHVPEVLLDLCTDRLLTMTWQEGQALEPFLTDHPDRRNTLGESLFRLWYTPFFRYGVLHADPHPGNYSVRPDGSINLVDYGSVRIFTPEQIDGVVGLYYAMRDDDVERAAVAYRQWGFENLNKEMIEVLNIWAKFIFAPALEDKTQTLHEQQNHNYGIETAQKVWGELRRVGGIKVPRPFVLMDRVSIVLTGVFLTIDAALNWHRMMEELAEQFDRDRLEREQPDLLSRHGLSAQDERATKEVPGEPSTTAEPRSGRRRRGR